MSKTIIAIAIAVILVGGGGAAAAFVMLNNNGNNSTPDTPDTPGEDFKIDVLKDKVEVGDYITIKNDVDMIQTGTGHGSWQVDDLYESGNPTGRQETLKTSISEKGILCDISEKIDGATKTTYWNVSPTGFMLKKVESSSSIVSSSTTTINTLYNIDYKSTIEQQKSQMTNGAYAIYDRTQSIDYEYIKAAITKTEKHLFDSDKSGQITVIETHTTGYYTMKYEVNEIYTDKSTGKTMVSLKNFQDGMTLDSFMAFLSYSKFVEQSKITVEPESHTDKVIDTNFGKRNVIEEKYVYSTGAVILVDHNDDIMYSRNMGNSSAGYTNYILVDTNMFV